MNDIRIKKLEAEKEELIGLLDKLSSEIISISPFENGIDDNTRDLARKAELLIEQLKGK